jgi:hypothetical protein
MLADGLHEVDLERLRPFIREDLCFYAPPGREHYRLLAHLSTTFSGRTIFDIGTHRGDSAIALSYNERNLVESFDVIDAVPTVRKMRRNVRYNHADLWAPNVREDWREVLLASPLIFIDIDPHEGTRELEFVSWLRENKYQGTIVLDDIWYFKGMRENLWSKIPSHYKSDLTEFGHWSGTGIVSFEKQSPTPNSQGDWTVVTGYFDLTGRDDSNESIRGRPSDHYIEEHASGTLSLDRNMIVFCERKNTDRIFKMRPEWLRSKTHIIETELDAFPLSAHYEELKKTRIGSGHCARDPRNTASYYLFCMARFAMVKTAIAENPFGSELFAWTNICIERMGFRNLVKFDRALNTQRAKFSTAYIDYLPKNVFQSLETFFGKDGCRDANGPCGRCSMCSGFFTGNSRYMNRVADLVEDVFLKCLRAGYGHADEQLITLVHHDAPELFDWYPADYAQMITNYAGLVENAEGSIRNLVRKSFEAADWKVCARACELIWHSYSEGRCQISDVDLSLLLAAKSASLTATSA